MIVIRRHLLLFTCFAAAAQTPTFSETEPGASPRLAALARQVASGNLQSIDGFWQQVRRSGAPLIESIPGDNRNSLVTFLWQGDAQTRNIAIFDGVAGFDSRDRMARLANTNVWYKTYRVRSDARFAYNLVVNDLFQPLPGDRDSRGRGLDRHLALFRTDPLNPRRCPSTFGELNGESSWVELPAAPARPWNPSARPPAGSVESRNFPSDILKNERKLWIYTPVGFSTARDRYPLLVVFDGDRNLKWIPSILDNLIARKRIPPVIAVMIDNPSPAARQLELPCHPPFGAFLAQELVPWLRQNRHATLDPARTVAAGASFGGLAAMFAGLRHSDVFGNAIALSGSFWWKPENDDEPEWLARQFAAASKLPLRLYLEVGLMESYEMQVSTNRHMRNLLVAKGYGHRYSEYNGGHSFLNWSDATARGLVFLLGR